VVYAATGTAMAGEVIVSPPIVTDGLGAAPMMDAQPKLCRIDDPDCEACQ